MNRIKVFISSHDSSVEHNSFFMFGEYRKFESLKLLRTT